MTFLSCCRPNRGLRGSLTFVVVTELYEENYPVCWTTSLRAAPLPPAPASGSAGVWDPQWPSRLHTGLPWAPGLITGGRLTTSEACLRSAARPPQQLLLSVCRCTGSVQTDRRSPPVPTGTGNMGPPVGQVCREAPAGEAWGCHRK